MAPTGHQHPAERRGFHFAGLPDAAKPPELSEPIRHCDGDQNTHGHRPPNAWRRQPRHDKRRPKPAGRQVTGSGMDQGSLFRLRTGQAKRRDKGNRRNRKAIAGTFAMGSGEPLRRNGATARMPEQRIKPTGDTLRRMQRSPFPGYRRPSISEPEPCSNHHIRTRSERGSTPTGTARRGNSGAKPQPPTSHPAPGR